MDVNDMQALPAATGGSPWEGTAPLFEVGARTALEFPTAAAAEAYFRQLQQATLGTPGPTPFEYGFPADLLDLIVDGVGEDRFDQQALQRERELSRGRNDRHIGRWGVWRLVSDLLAEDASTVDPLALDSADFNLKAEQLRRDLLTAHDRLKTLHTSRVGYAGWLCTRAPFVEEHDALLRKHRDRFLIDGFPLPLSVPDPTQPTRYVRAYPSTPAEGGAGFSPLLLGEDEWLADYHAFCERWRLSHLAGPLMPEPLAAQIPLVFDGRSGTGTFVIPDIYPIGGRGFIGEAIEDALRGGQRPGREHLQDWFDIVGIANAAKNRIDRYGRWLSLQHHWRLLHQRHATALEKQKGRLIDAFAGFFKCSSDSVKDDLKEIVKRLGDDWPVRPDPLAAD